MAEEDIYGSKRKYYRFIEDLESLNTPPPPAQGKGKRKYYCQNPTNLRHFLTLLAPIVNYQYRNTRSEPLC